MNRARVVGLFALFAAGALCGCRLLKGGEKDSSTPAPSAATNTVAVVDFNQHVRDNCASLLYDLLNDEKNLSKILLIKRDSDQLHALVEEISTAAANGAKKLEQLAAADRSLHLDAMSLPSGEAATREAISKTKTGELLHAKGADFEFALLLTQVEALNYGEHLARVAAAHDAQPDRVREFSALGDELKRLHERVVQQLKTK